MSDIDLEYPALACGIARDEGIMVAYILENSEEGTLMQEHVYRDGDRFFEVFSIDGEVMDMLPYDTKPVKWWMVREAARSLGLDYPEPILTCPAEDFRVSCLPDVPTQPGRVLAFRQYGRGPWIKISPKDLDNAAKAAEEQRDDARTITDDVTA